MQSKFWSLVQDKFGDFVNTLLLNPELHAPSKHDTT